MSGMNVLRINVLSIILSAVKLLTLFLVLHVQYALAIDCFKCVSINGDFPACEDPFHNNFSASILDTPCWGGRKNRDGVFPATACVKLNGVFLKTGKTMMIRDCALDSGTLTTDTGRMSHCGGFYFDNEYVQGCVQSCFEDACNSSLLNVPIFIHTLFNIAIALSVTSVTMRSF